MFLPMSEKILGICGQNYILALFALHFVKLVVRKSVVFAAENVVKTL
jgi:hypothetical protein